MTRTLGLADGLAFWWKAKQKSFGEIRASKWNTSFRLRPGTTDYDTYEHVFVLKEYDFPIPFEPKLIVDGGANIGMSALYFARRFPQARIVSIEPDPANCALLQHNTRDYPQVESLQKGIWSKSGHLLIVELHDRMVPGCSKSLFDAVSKYDFDCETRWENLIFYNKQLG